MSLSFTKMQGLGNDFVVLDGVRESIRLMPEQIRHIADRRLGVGCDQLLLVEPATLAGADFRYRIWNADGGEVEHCGNGIRCVARFIAERGLSDARHLTFQTRHGLIRTERLNDGRVRVDMGPPMLEPARIPFLADTRANQYPLRVADNIWQIAAVSMGNPHAVLRVDDVDQAPVDTLGPLIEQHADFPERVNVGFMQIVDRQHLRLRVFERAVGETPACGTGACAAVVAAILNGWTDAKVEVSVPGGQLMIDWQGVNTPVWMTGPAVSVFEGRLAAGMA
ncbi:MAG: diaminopimelate epimerase [Gammaproteobacteria bacterium]|nr:diaminopimelate epimerase [Gammaproteobacteria bacterium]